MVSARLPDKGYSSSSAMCSEERAQSMLDDIEAEMRGKGRAIVVVVESRHLRELQDKAPKLLANSVKDKSPVLIIHNSMLGKTVTEITRNSQITSLTIMTGETIPRISFQVPVCSIKTLKIRRLSLLAGEHDALFIDGASKFNTTRLDEWKAVPHGSVKLHFGRGVHIQRDEKPARKPSQNPDDDPEKQNGTKGPSDPEDPNGGDPSDPGSSNRAAQPDDDDDLWSYIKAMISVVLGSCAFWIALTTKITAKAAGGYFEISLKDLVFKGGAFASKAAITIPLPWCIVIGVVVSFAAYYVLSQDYFLSLKPTLTSWASSFRKWWNNASDRASSDGSHLSHLII